MQNKFHAAASCRRQACLARLKRHHKTNTLARNKFHAYDKDVFLHKEDKRRCALEETFWKRQFEPQRTPRRFALHRENNINKEIMVSPYLPLCSLWPLWLEKRSLTHKENKRRCALEKTKSNLLFFITFFSFYSLYVKDSLNHRVHRGASRYTEKIILTKSLWSLPLCSLCPLWLEKRSLTHKEDKRCCALEERTKLTSKVTSLSSHYVLFVKRQFEPQSTPRRFALHRENNINKEDKRRCALENTISNLLFSLIVFSFCSLCAICFNAK